MLTYARHHCLDQGTLALAAPQSMLRVTQELPIPRPSRAISIGPLSSLPCGHLRIGHLNTDHLQTNTPSHPKVMGVGPDYPVPSIGSFSPQHLSRWEALTSDAWVVLTLSKGYRIEFRRRPPQVQQGQNDCCQGPPKVSASKARDFTLLEKGAIEFVNILDWMRGFYSNYFPVPKDGGFSPILDLRQLNQFVKVLLFLLFFFLNLNFYWVFTCI